VENLGIWNAFHVELRRAMLVQVASLKVGEIFGWNVTLVSLVISTFSNSSLVI